MTSILYFFNKMTARDHLYVYAGDWNLPTVDIDCLRVLLHVAWASTDCIIHQVDTPFLFSCNTLPVLADAEGTILASSSDQIIKHIMINMDDRIGAEATRWMAYASVLDDALCACWWLDEKNRVSIEQVYAQRMSLVARWTLLHQEQAYNNVLKKLRSRYGNMAPSNIVNAIKSRVAEVLAHLEDELDVHTFSSASISIVSYFILATNARMPNPWFKEQLRQHSKLRDFTSRYIQKLLVEKPFSESIYAQIAPKMTIAARFRYYAGSYRNWMSDMLRETASSSNEREHFKIRQILSIGIGLASLVLFAWKRGLLAVEFRNEVDAEEEDE